MSGPGGRHRGAIGFVRAVFITGAVLDGLTLVPMLVPGVGGAMFGIAEFSRTAAGVAALHRGAGRRWPPRFGHQCGRAWFLRLGRHPSVCHHPVRDHLLVHRDLHRRAKTCSGPAEDVDFSACRSRGARRPGPFAFSLPWKM